MMNQTWSLLKEPLAQCERLNKLTSGPSLVGGKRLRRLHLMTGNSLESKQLGEHHFQGGENSIHKSPEGWQLRCFLETANSSEAEAQDWGELSGVTVSGQRAAETSHADGSKR